MVTRIFLSLYPEMWCVRAGSGCGTGERDRFGESFCCCPGKLELKMQELKAFLTAALLAYASRVFQPWTGIDCTGARKASSGAACAVSWLDRDKDPSLGAAPLGYELCGEGS